MHEIQNAHSDTAKTLSETTGGDEVLTNPLIGGETPESRLRCSMLRVLFNLHEKTDRRIDLLCQIFSNPKTSRNHVIDLSDIDLSGANFGTQESVHLEPILASGPWNLTIKGVNFENANLQGANLDGATLQECNLDRANLSNATLKYSTFDRCSLRQANLSNSNLENAKLHMTILVNGTLENASLRHTSFGESSLDNANLTHCDISSATFELASLSHVNLTTVTVDEETQFKRIRNPIGCRITRLTLDSLINCGGLTIGNLAKMTVVDDVARLRQTFGGPWFWSHLCLAICFFLPYARFIVERLIRAYSAAPGSEQISLGRSLWNFIWSGGVTWTKAELHLVSFTCFVLFSLYNVLRITLLWKTARLETDQFVTKIPSDFSLDTSPTWKAAYVAVDWLKYLAILVALIHTCHFLSVTMVPIDR